MGDKRARSPRRIDFSHQALQAIDLDDSPPAKDSISWKLWSACHDVALEALHTDYVQGIQHGNLDPNRFGQYTVQDAVYCHHGQDDYQTLENRALKQGHEGLAAFAAARGASYAKYIAEIFKAWHIRDVNGFAPGQAAETYLDFEKRVATHRKPVYGILAMIPCDQLWSYLGSELKPAAGPGNLYSFWITGNADWSGAYRLDNFIDRWFAAHPETYSWETALYVYRSCMTCEVNFFRSACDQKLLPMPPEYAR